MEGFAEQYSYDDDAWQKKFIRATPEFLYIFKSDTDDKPEKTYNIVGSRAKKLKRTQFNKENVFKLEIGVIKLVFSVSDDEVRKSFIHYFRNSTKRVSLIASKVKRISLSQPKRESLAVLSRTDLMAENFNLEEYVKSYDFALENRDTQNGQLNYAKLCAKFLSISHQQIESAIKQGTEVKSIEGLTIQEICQLERPMAEKRIASLAWVASQQIEYLYVPLLSMFTTRGRSFLVSIDMFHPRSKMSAGSNIKLLHLKMQLGVTDDIVQRFNMCEDKKGRLWILDASSIYDMYESDDTISNISKELDNMEYFIYDSITLNVQLNRMHVLTQHLPKIANQLTNPMIKKVVETEMIARLCMNMFNYSYNQSKDWKPQIVEIFNNVLLDDTMYWNSTLAQNMLDTFDYTIPPKVSIPRFELFIALQNTLGVDFSESKDYKFDTPLNESQVMFEQVVPNHQLLELCYSVRPNKKNEFNLFCDMKYEECCASLNERASVIQTLYGEQNPMISTIMGILTICYCFAGNLKFAKLCFETCKTTNREISPIIGLATVSLENYDQGAQLISYCLGENHWFEGLFYHSAAIIEFRAGNYDHSLQLTTQAKKFYGEFNKLTNSLQFLVGKILLTQGKLKDLKTFVESEMKDSPFKYLLQAQTLYNDKFYEESLNLAKQAYQKFCYYSDEFIAYENIQILANNFDVICDFDNAFIFYNTLFTRDFSGENENKSPSCRIIAKNIIRLFFKSMAINNANQVASLRQQALNEEFPGIDKLLDEICANGPVEYLKSAKPDAYPKIYKLIL